MAYFRNLKRIGGRIYSRILRRIARDIRHFLDDAVPYSPHEINDFNAVVSRTAVIYKSARMLNNSGGPEAITILENSHVRGILFTFWNAGSIRIGRWSYVGEGTRIWSQSSVAIGDYVLIGHHVDIFDTDGHPLDLEARRTDWEGILSGNYCSPTKTKSASVKIEDNVWIGSRSIILKGVCIGDGAVVAAGSVVTKNVAPRTLVAGNPAKIVRQLGNN